MNFRQSNITFEPVLKICVISVLCALACFDICAQQNCSDKLMQRCADLAHKSKYQKATNLLQRSLVSQPNCVESYIRLSDLYYRTGNTMLAISCCNQAISVQPSEGINATMFLLRQMLYYQNDSAALELLSLANKNPNLNGAQKGYLQNEYLNLYSKLSIINAPGAGTVLNLGDSVNDMQQQYFPTCNSDGTVLVFTGIEKDLNEDFLYSRYDSCTGWSKAKNLGYPPNTGDPDGSAQLSNDGRYLFFTRCNTSSENGYDGGGCDIIFTFLQNDGAWSSPQIFGATINSPTYEGQPCLSSDNKVMYFVSDRPEGFGGRDIYKTEYLGGYWQQPVNLGPQINTKGDELSPFIHADGKHLYFASNGQRGAGKLDLYVACATDTTWSAPQNLGFPINTPSDENSICVTAAGDRVFFASDRLEGKGKFDIYASSLVQRHRPTATVCVQGRLFDKYTKETLKEHRIYVQAADSVAEPYVFLSNAGDGSFSFPIQANAMCKIWTEPIEGFLPYSSTIRGSDAQGSVLTKNLFHKMPGLIDTLGSYSYSGSTHADTNLRHLALVYPMLNTEANDSIQIFINVCINTYVDTAMLQTFCFSDSGRLEYLAYNDQQRLELENAERTFVDFYLSYLHKAGIPQNRLAKHISIVADNKMPLLHIETSLVEYY
jgi:hypothetical protein